MVLTALRSCRRKTRKAYFESLRSMSTVVHEGHVLAIVSLSDYTTSTPIWSSRVDVVCQLSDRAPKFQFSSSSLIERFPVIVRTRQSILPSHMLSPYEHHNHPTQRTDLHFHLDHHPLSDSPQSLRPQCITCKTDFKISMRDLQVVAVRCSFKSRTSLKRSSSYQGEDGVSG